MLAPALNRISPPRFLFCLTALLILSAGAGLRAQDQQPEDVIRVRTDLVAVPAIVTDGRGRRVPDLKAADFVLLDDQRLRKIEYFAAGTEKVALLFALDTSGSARETIARQREAALQLFTRFGKGSRVAVLDFGSVVRLSVPFTTDTEAAQNAFKVEAKENSGTAIFDGAAAAVRSFDSSGGFSTERRIVILMSDGLDTLSSTKYQTVIDLARRRAVSFYVIHFPLFSPRDGELAPREPSKGFRELAHETAGRYFKVGDVKSALDPHAQIDLSHVFEAIDEDLRGQYVLGFYPDAAARDDQTHHLTVSLRKRPRGWQVNMLRDEYKLGSVKPDLVNAHY